MMEHIRNRTSNWQLDTELFTECNQGGSTGHAFGNAVSRSEYLGERSAFAKFLAEGEIS